MLKKSPLLSAILIILVIYLALRFLVIPPIPQSLMIQYMVFVIIGVLLVVSFDDKTFEKFLAPIHSGLGDPNKKVIRWIFLILVPLLVGWATFDSIKPNFTAPIELRTVHPAPPSSIRLYGKLFNLNNLENPLREDKENYEENTMAGGEIYYQNCFFCHGDKLDGNGHFASGFNPQPANFQDVGTIAQLQESYLFWRIATGGPGLPQEGAPWASAMPVWHERLSEEEIWQVILFLYDYTGHVPRSWKKRDFSQEKQTIVSQQSGEVIYLKRCVWCHGEEGEGDGPAADLMYPRPRDFTLGLYKYKTSNSDEELPFDVDLKKTIQEGLPGTGMPGWQDLIDEQGIDELIKHLKILSEIEETPIGGVDYGTEISSTNESIAKGKVLFKETCVQCHGEEGKGNITSGKKLESDWGYRIWPRDLTKPDTWRFTFNRKDLFSRISNGIPGTPMPNHTDTLSTEDRWHLVNYVTTLRQNNIAIDPAKTVITAKFINEVLPTKANDPIWKNTEAVSFRLVPNVIQGERLFYSLNNQVTVKSVYNREEITFLLEWNDRTYSVPGSELGQQYVVEDIDLVSDAVAVQFPEVPTDGISKPSIRHGDEFGNTQIWYWNAGSEDPPLAASASILLGKDHEKIPRPIKGQTLFSESSWKNGTWRVVIKRPREGLKGDGSSVFKEGRYIPISFALWDGTYGEQGSQHSLSSWYWLLLPAEPNLLKIYGLPILVFLVILLGGIWISFIEIKRFKKNS